MKSKIKRESNIDSHHSGFYSNFEETVEKGSSINDALIRNFELMYRSEEYLKNQFGFNRPVVYDCNAKITK